MAPKKDMKAALSASIKHEERKTADRFAKAEAALDHAGGPAAPLGNPVVGGAAIGQERKTDLPTAPAPASQPAGERDKLIRDTFSFPSSDHALFGELLDRMPALRLRTTKSELVRAGLRALAKLSDAELEEELRGLERLKPGNPRR